LSGLARNNRADMLTHNMNLTASDFAASCSFFYNGYFSMQCVHAEFNPSSKTRNLGEYSKLSEHAQEGF
jgi:hypothetical protein